MDSSTPQAKEPSPRYAAFLRQAVEERIPLNGSIALTHRCNLRCVHCYLGRERTGVAGGSDESDTSFWRGVVDQLADAGCLSLLITGGEPLLRDDFAEIYRHVVRRGILATVFTNATRVDDTVLDAFAQFPPRLVEVTLYGASEEVFDKVTGVPGSHRRCLAGLDALARAKVRIGLKSMIMVENRHEISAMRVMAEERGAAFRVDPALFPRRDGNADPLSHRIPAAEAVALEMADGHYRDKAAAYFQRVRDTAPADRLYSCMAGRTGFHVDPAGTLLPCLMVTSHGFDLHHGSFLAGWREVIPPFLEQEIAPGYECHRCEKRFICGVCPAQSQMETGNAYGKPEYQCRLGEARCRALGDPLAPRADEG
jgi:radical SAM protein with 4Fe4S-binding SPASM domain